METSKERTQVDWEDCMLKFMKLIGESSNEWHPELWEEYGINKSQAREILNKYQNRYE